MSIPHRLAISAFAMVSVIGGVALAQDAPSTTSRIVVNVGTFRNRTGVLICRLFKSADGFPEGTAGTVEERVAIGGGVTSCSFENVRPGTYAVSVIHDENGNQKLDKNIFGVPTEGYGVSNNHTHALRASTWDESKFSIEAGKNLGLGIGLRY